MTWLPDDIVDRLRDVASRPELSGERYRILRPLGRGGMGTVYAAHDALLDREVAIKVTNAAAAGTPLEDRLRHEARVIARLEHPGIVPVHDAGTLEDGRLFYVMKLVRGETLAEHLARLESEASRLAVFERIAETAAFAHAAGVVHRDLKPSNVMIGSFGEVLVLDWGVAKLLGSPPADGMRIGTPGFMAPEQQRGDGPDVGPHSDVYALGALLYWILTGGVPSGARDELARKLRAATPAPRRPLQAIALHCLEPRPADRYAHAGEIVAEIARYRDGLAVRAHRETFLEGFARWFRRYRTFILLVVSYLVMRALFAFLQR